MSRHGITLSALWLFVIFTPYECTGEFTVSGTAMAIASLLAVGVTFCHFIPGDAQEDNTTMHQALTTVACAIVAAAVLVVVLRYTLPGAGL